MKTGSRDVIQAAACARRGRGRRAVAAAPSASASSASPAPDGLPAMKCHRSSEKGPRGGRSRGASGLARTPGPPGSNTPRGEPWSPPPERGSCPTIPAARGRGPRASTSCNWRNSPADHGWKATPSGPCNAGLLRLAPRLLSSRAPRSSADRRKTLRQFYQFVRSTPSDRIPVSSSRQYCPRPCDPVLLVALKAQHHREAVHCLYEAGEIRHERPGPRSITQDGLLGSRVLQFDFPNHVQHFVKPLHDAVGGCDRWRA